MSIKQNITRLIKLSVLFSFILLLVGTKKVDAADCGTRSESPCSASYCDDVCRQWCDSQSKPDCIATYGTDTTLWDNCCYDGMAEGTCTRVGVDEKKECECDNFTASPAKVEYPYFQCSGTTQASPPLIPPYVYCGAGLTGGLCCDSQASCDAEIPPTPTTRPPTPTRSPSSTPGPSPTPRPFTPYEAPSNSFFDMLNPLQHAGGESMFDDSPSEYADQLSTPGGIVSRLLAFAFPLAGLILFVMLVWGGFEILIQAPSKKGIDAGKQRVSAAIIGFILLFSSYWIWQIIEVVFGINIF